MWRKGILTLASKSSEPMKTLPWPTANTLPVCFLCVAALVQSAGLASEEFPAVDHGRSARAVVRLRILRDPASGTVTVSWNGKGVLKQSETLGGRFKPTRTRGDSHTTEPEGQQMLYRVEAAVEKAYSANIVGYVNLWLPPGQSLIANPLRATDNTLGVLIPEAPDGSQVLRYVPGVGYEVSTFDALENGWSDPEMDLSPGIGFFFNNTSPDTLRVTFVGNVLLGVLVNPLPAGFSTKGELLPQSGSINSLHGIPGQPGDILRLYENDLQGGGGYVTSVFSATDNAWVPDLNLGIAQGFVSEKQAAQDWVRVFTIVP